APPGSEEEDGRTEGQQWRPVGPASWTPALSGIPNRPRSHKLPGLVPSLASAVDQGSELTGCLHLLGDCPGFQELTDPSLLKESPRLPHTALGSSKVLIRPSNLSLAPHDN
uniref:Uncharacterized protein n=1 Tax=Peromyscus maniculatus bairdii TaxID=230844 RepID=A0A8C8W4B0_PERMB